MKACVWYTAQERTPDKPGWYTTFVGPTIGGGDCGVCQCYWHPYPTQWTDSESARRYPNYRNVIFWTDANPYEWYENYDQRQSTKEMHPMVEQAWQEVVESINRYEVISRLTTDSSDLQ